MITAMRTVREGPPRPPRDAASRAREEAADTASAASGAFRPGCLRAAGRAKGFSPPLVVPARLWSDGMVGRPLDGGPEYLLPC